ncbi:MAG: hypothetical protein HYS78_02260 [Parcubacteria group bacterium]|nr:hypothetical protein [Parcubacteria group bacterium]
MKRIVYFLLSALIGITAISLFASTANAAYFPDEEFVRKMATELRKAPGQVIGDLAFKELRVGETYEDNDVAYFFAIPVEPEIFMQLEEWRAREDGSFVVTFWRFGIESVVRWINIYEPDRSFTTQPLPDLPITDSEAIAKSEKTQEILRTIGLKWL